MARSGPLRSHLMPDLHPLPIVRRARAEGKRSAAQRCRSGRKTKPSDWMPDASPTHNLVIVSVKPADKFVGAARS